MADETSYTAAGRFPWKLLRRNDAVMGGKIRPLHLQLIPTNRCNAHCRWCSCSKVDRKIELPFEEVRSLLRYFADLGTKALTITGGGEPTMYGPLNALLLVARDMGIECGIVTNGLLWAESDRSVLRLANEALTWARVSIADVPGGYDGGNVTRICRRLPSVDVGVSYTVGNAVDTDLARHLCAIAENEVNLTHIRFVQDILDPTGPWMTRVEDACATLTRKAIFQRRDTWDCGVNPCLISLLKPVVDATGCIYPCCGVQYATDDARHMPPAFNMGHWSQFHKMRAFNGAICKKCYYGAYNECLARLTEPLSHEAFV